LPENPPSVGGSPAPPPPHDVANAAASSVDPMHASFRTLSCHWMGMSESLREHIALHLAGDERGTDAVARAALTLALRTAAAVLGSREAASDVAQDVAVEVIARVKTLRDPAAFEAWVHRITVRRTMHAIRARDRRREEPLDERDLPCMPDPAGARAEPLVDALRELPERQRVALALRYVHDLSDREIAAALGCREGTVASLLSRGRAALRRNPSIRALAPNRSEGATP
jgi:RNA polymerase sigma factor (sigma-70 family)